MKALAVSGAAVESVEMLALVVGGIRLGCQLEMRDNYVGGFNQHGRGALLAILVDEQPQAADITTVHGNFSLASGDLAANLVAANGLKADRRRRSARRRWQ